METNFRRISAHAFWRARLVDSSDWRQLSVVCLLTHINPCIAPHHSFIHGPTGNCCLSKHTMKLTVLIKDHLCHREQKGAQAEEGLRLSSWHAGVWHHDWSVFPAWSAMVCCRHCPVSGSCGQSQDGQRVHCSWGNSSVWRSQRTKSDGHLCFPANRTLSQTGSYIALHSDACPLW